MFNNCERKIEDLKNQNQYLQWELEEKRREEEEAYNQKLREREEQRKRSIREYEEDLCYAKDWPDAFLKGKIKARREAQLEKIDNEAGVKDPLWEGWKPTTYFQDFESEIERAEIIYHEEMENSESEIQRLQKEIEKIKTGVLKKVADRMEKEGFPQNGIINALIENQPDYLTNW